MVLKYLQNGSSQRRRQQQASQRPRPTVNGSQQPRPTVNGSQHPIVNLSQQKQAVNCSPIINASQYRSTKTDRQQSPPRPVAYRQRSPPPISQRQRSPPPKSQRKRSSPLISQRQRSPPPNSQRQRSPPPVSQRQRSPPLVSQRQRSPPPVSQRQRSPLSVSQCPNSQSPLSTAKSRHRKAATEEKTTVLGSQLPASQPRGGRKRKLVLDPQQRRISDFFKPAATTAFSGNSSGREEGTSTPRANRR